MTAVAARASRPHAISARTRNATARRPALLARGFPVPAVADPTRVGQTAPARGHSLPFRSADHAAQDSNHERISVPEVSQFSQQRLTSIGHYESAWRTENTGSNLAGDISSQVIILVQRFEPGFLYPCPASSSSKTTCRTSWRSIRAYFRRQACGLPLPPLSAARWCRL